MALRQLVEAAFFLSLLFIPKYYFLFEFSLINFTDTEKL